MVKCVTKAVNENKELIYDHPSSIIVIMPERENPIRDFLIHAFYLALTVLLLWFWVNNPVLVNYNLQLTAFLVIVYFVARLFLAKEEKSRPTLLGEPRLILETIIFTAILLLILSSTGGLSSSFFFLIYFLLFTTALLFDPPITLTLTLALTLFFANTLNSLHAALQLLSLLFITPLAIYFGRQYLKLLEAQDKVKILAKKSHELYSVSSKLSANITNEETNSLLWLSLDFKNSLLKIIHQTSELLSDISHLTFTQKETLQSIHESAKEVLKTGQKLKEKIDKETDG